MRHDDDVELISVHSALALIETRPAVAVGEWAGGRASQQPSSSRVAVAPAGRVTGRFITFARLAGCARGHYPAGAHNKWPALVALSIN